MLLGRGKHKPGGTRASVRVLSLHGGRRDCEGAAFARMSLRLLMREVRQAVQTGLWNQLAGVR